MRPTIQPFIPKLLGPKDWGTELLIAQTEHYIGKVLTMDPGQSGPLQYHERKDETFYLLSGRAIVRYLDMSGTLQSRAMSHGEAYRIPPGAVHQVEAVTTCIFIEASTPVFDDRVAWREPSVLDHGG